MGKEKTILTAKKKMKSPKNLKFRRIYALAAAFFFVLFRIGGDFLFVFLGLENYPIFVYWKTFSFLLIFAALFVYAFTKKEREYDFYLDLPSKNFKGEIGYVWALLVGLIVLSTPIYEMHKYAYLTKTFYVIAYFDVLFSFYAFVSITITFKLYKWFINKKHKRTDRLLLILGVGAAFSFLIDYLCRIALPDYIPQVSFALGITTIILAGISLSAPKMQHWVASLPSEERGKIIGLSFLVLLTATTVSTGILFGDGTVIKWLNWYLPGSKYLFGLSIIYFQMYMANILFFCFVAFFASNTVEKKTRDFTSLNYLNKLIAQTIDFKKLSDAVTEFALNNCEANGAWIEIYDGDKVKIVSNRFIDIETIEELHRNGTLRRILGTGNSPVFIESTTAAPELNFIPYTFRHAQSIIAVPIMERGSRFGTLVVFHKEEFGLERSDLNLLSAFGDNINLAVENTRLLEASFEKERYKKELMLAREIQKKLLPENLPQTPGFALNAFTLPADEVGGDYFDILKLKTGEYCFLIGDVSGKGITAAFYMAQLKGVTLSVAKESVSSKDILRRINETLYGSMEKQMFITMSAVTLCSDGSLNIARAGHSPFFFKRNGSTEVVSTKGIGIGLARDEVFERFIEERKVNMKSNDVCLLITDGVNELRNDAKEEFGYEPLKKILQNKEKDTDAGKALEIIKTELEKFAQNAPRHDDLTMAVIVYLGKGNKEK